MKILFVSQYFYPETFRGNDVVFDLCKKGNDITVITAIPNYPYGHFFEGYGLFKKRKEIVNGVRVIRIPVVSRGNSGAFRLMLNYFSFALIASVYCFYLSFREKFDLIFVQQLSPVTMSLPAIVLKKIQKIPLLLWVLDLWPESLTSAGGVRNKFVLACFDKFVKLQYSNANKILVSSRGFVNSIKKYGKYGDKIIYFPNWAEDTFTTIVKYNIPTFPDGFIVMFAGNIGEAQNLEVVLHAALILKSNDNIKWIFIGDGRKKSWLDDYIAKNELDSTVFTFGRFPIEVMPTFFEKADLMLISLKDELIFNLTVPAKLQAYMASSKPIVGLLKGEGAEIIREANCGIVTTSNDPVDFASVVLDMSKKSKKCLREFGDNGFRYYNSNFLKINCFDKLDNIIKGVL